MFLGNMTTIKSLARLKQLGKILLVLPLSLIIILAWTAIDESVAQLRLDYAALRAAEDDYRAQREFNGLDGVEAADYASYVARLQRRVFEDCWAVTRSGSPYPDDLPCPVILPQESQSADIVTQEEQTPGEQVAALDGMLNAGLGEYDERLLREQERIKAASPNSNSEGSGDGGAGSEGEGQGEGEESEGGGQEGSEAETEGDRESESDSQSSGGAPGEQREGGAESGQRGRGPKDSSTGPGTPGKDSDEPADIPDGSDDDVVARQLREAAEKETDPELKAKLWEEYRRYKRGTD
jgi:hypothetical protein